MRDVKEVCGSDAVIVEDIYSLPLLPKALNHVKIFQYIPFLPCYKGFNCGQKCDWSKNKATAEERNNVIVDKKDDIDTHSL